MTDAIDPRDGSWLSGLADGEGAFMLSASKRNGGRHTRVEFSFALALRADDHKTLEEIRRITGVGQLSRQSGPRLFNATNGQPYRGNPMHTYFVRKRAEIPRLIDVFRTHPLRSKKRRDFELWADAFERYVSALAAAPRSPRAVQRGLRFRNGKVHRPMAGTPRKQLRATPDDLFSELATYARHIREQRRFNQMEASL
jgi:hypothetical protein